MKKLVLFAAVALSMTMFSCGKGEQGAAVDSDSIAAAEAAAQAPDTTAQDTTAQDTTAAAPAAEQAK